MDDLRLYNACLPKLEADLAGNSESTPYTYEDHKPELSFLRTMEMELGVRRLDRRKMLKVIALTGGKNIPSARFRVRQLIPELRACGVEINEAIALLGAYPPKSHAARPLWALSTLASRLPAISRSHCYDVVMLQREFVSTFFTLEAFTKRPRVLDIDDAIWLHRDGFAKKLSQCAGEVVCGNGFLAEQFMRWNHNVTIIPTAVDTRRYKPSATEPSDLAIGWSGTSSGFDFLYNIEQALGVVLNRFPRVKLHILADMPPRFSALPQGQVEFARWSDDNEVRFLQNLSIGIMPIPDSDWARGKCSFKMLTYMACGLPVVVAPVGMNAEVLRQGEIGYGPTSHDEWVDALTTLILDSTLRERLGMNGRTIVKEHYSVTAVAPKLASVLKRASLN